MSQPRFSIPITKPYIGPEELEAIRRPLESGWLVQGPLVKEFEDKFGGYTAADHAIAASSCTTSGLTTSRMSPLGRIFTTIGVPRWLFCSNW